jgi:hypothetical protein
VELQDCGLNCAYGSAVSSSLNRLAHGGGSLNSDDWGNMTADAFGNALATEVVGAMQKREQQSAADKIRQGGSPALAEYLAKNGMSPDQVKAFMNDEGNQGLLYRADRVRDAESSLGKNIEDMTLEEQARALGPVGTVTIEEIGEPTPASRAPTQREFLHSAVNGAADMIESGSNAVNWLVDKLGGEDNAARAIFGVQALIGGVPRAVVGMATGAMKDGLFGQARTYATEKVGNLISEHVFGVDETTEATYAQSAKTLSNSIAGFGISTIGDGAKGIVKSSKGVSSARMSMAAESSTNVNAGVALNRKQSALQGAQEKAARVRELPDGRTRYYEKERLADKPGPSRGSSYVTEHNPANGNVRSWNEVYDHDGKVNRVHPKMINGQQVDSQHYPPTAKELGL